MSQSPPILSGFRIQAEQEAGKTATITGNTIDWDEVPDGVALSEPLQLKSIKGNIAILLVQPSDDNFNGHAMAAEYPVILGEPADDNALQWAQYIEKKPDHVSPFYALIHNGDPLELTKFRGVIENWKPTQTEGRAFVLSGTLIGYDGSLEPAAIEKTSTITGRDGNHVVTASGSRYALGKPREDVPQEVKARLLNMLPQVPAETAENNADQNNAPIDPDFLKQQLG